MADYNTGYIKKFTPDYKWVKTFSDYGEAPGENIKSEFMSIYNGLLYMPEAGNHRVDVFDLDGNFKFLFGGKGTAPGKMNNPEAAKYNSEGKIYVADLKNDRVQVFDKDGNFLFLWGSSSPLSQFGGKGDDDHHFEKPEGIAVAPMAPSLWPIITPATSKSSPPTTSG